MPLPLVKLDDRTWTDLTTTARAAIPESAPSWTDHNLHDPGITLIELFAWLSEILLYQLDRVSPAMMRTFLRAAGITPLRASAASTVIAVKPGQTTSTTLDVGTGIGDVSQSIRFETVDALTVSPAWLELSPDEKTDRGRMLSDVGGVRRRIANGPPVEFFRPLGQAPAVGDALWLGFDTVPAMPGVELGLYVWTASWQSDWDELLRLKQEWPTDWRSHPSAMVIWEFWAGQTWEPIEVRTDDTRALTMSGKISFIGPSRHIAGPDDASRYWIRCRLEAGEYACPPRLSALAVNAVTARHAATVTGPEWIGASHGEPGLTCHLRQAPIIQGSTRLRLTGLDGTVDDSWTEVPEWDLTGPNDAHYRLDEIAGTISFGDGRVGRVPPAGSTISALRYVVGGGPEGNLRAGTLSVFADSSLSLAPLQPFAALGGTLPESVDRAHGRALDGLAEATRSITAGDLEQLALHVPGAPVARAQVLIDYHPQFPCIPASGVVTVVVVPPCGRPPLPPPGQVAIIQRFLEQRRPLTMQVIVIAPVYKTVTVIATLHVAPGSSTASLAATAQRLLDAFFDPLSGGPDRNGWPLGRSVLSSEILAVLASAPGVQFVDSLRLGQFNSDVATCSNISLCPTELVASQQHRIIIVEDAS